MGQKRSDLTPQVQTRNEPRNPPPPVPDEDDEEDGNDPLDAYLEQVMDKVGWLNLSGVDPSLAADAKRRRLALPAVYVQLEVLKRGGRRGLVVEEMGEEQRLVLLGDPGSGKSTFVNFVALCLAGERLGDEKANLSKLGGSWGQRRLLPVRVVLREFVVRGLPPIGQQATSEHLLRFLEKEVGAAFAPTLRDYLQGTKRHKRAMVLLDGFDEVPEANQRRQQVMDVVKDLLATYPTCHFLLTSRTYAWERQAWLLEGFAEARLEPFDQGQIERFIDRWYHEAEEQNLGVSPGQAQIEADKLKDTITNRQRLHELATRPLLLTLMTSLHAWRGGELPEKREKLYDSAVDLLLHIWERHRVVHDGDGETAEQALRDWLKVDPDKLLNALEQVAYQAHAGKFMVAGRSDADIPETELADALWKIRGGQSDLNPMQIIRYIEDRAGLLLPIGHGIYQFPHRSIQEYLAARYLTNHKRAQEIADLMMAEPERWQEVVLLAIAKAARGFKDAAWVLVDALAATDPPNHPTKEATWAAYVAAMAIIENDLHHNLPSLYQQRVERLKKWLVSALQTSLLPPVQRAEAGAALSSLGELRPDVVAFPPQLTADSMQGARGEFRASIYPITNAQFGEFMRATGEKAKFWHHKRLNEMNQPVVGVTYYQAEAFCVWLSGQTNARYALPTAEEWELIARGTQPQAYPWGDEWKDHAANTDETLIRKPCAVGIFPEGKSPTGAYDCAGNVWEWCDSWYNEEREQRILRGGSWESVREEARTHTTPPFWSPANECDHATGFRVIRLE